MQPQVIHSNSPSEEMVGLHNADLPKASAKIIEGSTWKKMRTVIIMPSDDMIHSKVAMSWASLMMPPNQSAHRILALGCEVGDAYSRAIADVLAHPDLSQWEYILTCEADNILPPDGLVKLQKQMDKHPEFAAISGLYFMKSFEPMAHIWGRPDLDPVVNFRPCPPVPDQLIETYGTSMGMTLFRMSIFKDERIPRPWFKTLNGDDGRGIGTQDLSFWGEARKYGYRCAVDCSVKVGHIDYDGRFSGHKGFVL